MLFGKDMWPVVLTTILLAALGADARQTGLSVEDFQSADRAAKLGILRDVAAPRLNIPIGPVILLVRAGLRDASADVRMAALGTVMGRTMAAGWAGSSGPMLGPSAGPRTAPPTIPLDWQGDQRLLLEALEGDCLALLNSDPDDRVRHQALLAIGTLNYPAQPDTPLSTQLVGLFVELYRRDPSTRIRAEVVKTLRLVPNNTPEIRAVLRDALVDPNASIRHEGLTALSPEATSAPRKLSFDEARDTVVAALMHSDPGIRLGAVRALNVFGTPAAPYLQALERLSDVDPDPEVRASARLAIESIERALRDRGGA